MQRALFLYWQPTQKTKKNCIVNFGPQHPAAHGVLRLLLQLEGELITRADPHIGLLHRGTESLIESKFYAKSIPYFDRLDYVSMATQEHAYCLAVEKLQRISLISKTVNLQRILIDEITRILNHMLAVSCHALDIGSMSALFWAFEVREKLMEYYERISGARMHAAVHSFQQPENNSINKTFLNDIVLFLQEIYTTLNEMHNILSYNKIWKQRTVNIGVYSKNIAQKWSLTGVMLRCTGIKRDIRLNRQETYSGYNTINFKSYLGINGDCFDRFNLRMLEMSESLNLLNQIINKLIQTPRYDTIIQTSMQKNNSNPYTYMEDLIEHFLKWHTGHIVPHNSTNVFIESPKGEFGVSIISASKKTPYRCKIRSPSYFNLQFLPILTKNHFIADLATLIGTIDIVFGEIDR